jgi:hypothetical protein
VFGYKRTTRLALALGFVGALLSAPSVGARPLNQNAAATSQVGPLGTFTSSVTVINPTTNAAQTIQLQFFNASGTIVCTQTQNSVAPGATAFWYVPNVTGCPEQNNGPLPAGSYSAVVSAGAPVYAVVSLASSNPSTGEQYNGITTSGAEGSSTTTYIPSVLREYYNNTSTVTVQNAGSMATTATIQLVGNGINTCVATPSLSPSASYTLDLEATLPNGSNGTTLPTGFNGAATIFGGVSSPCGTTPASSQPMAVISSKYELSETTTAGQYAAGNAFANGGTQAYVAGLYNNYYGNNSSLIVQNAGTGNTNVTVTYTGAGQSATDYVGSLAPGASHVFYTPNAGTCGAGCSGSLPSGWQGSAIVRSSSGNILAQVDKATSTGASMYNAAVSGTVNLFAPSVLNNYYSENSALTIQNVDPSNSATVQIVWGTSPSCTDTFTLGATQAQLIYIPNVNPSHGIPGYTFKCTIPSGYHAGATITSLGGQKLVGLISTAGNGVYSDDDAPGQ